MTEIKTTGPGGRDAGAAPGIAKVHLFTLAGCGACAVARRLLRRRGIRFQEVRGEQVADFRHGLIEVTGAPTVPQIVIDGEPIGGADSLLALDRLGVLLPRVRRERFPIAVVHRRWSLARLLAGRGPRRYEVRLLERDGRTIERHEAGSIEEATTLAEEVAS